MDGQPLLGVHAHSHSTNSLGSLERSAEIACAFVLNPCRYPILGCQSTRKGYESIDFTPDIWYWLPIQSSSKHAQTMHPEKTFIHSLAGRCESVGNDAYICIESASIFKVQTECIKSASMARP